MTAIQGASCRCCPSMWQSIVCHIVSNMRMLQGTLQHAPRTAGYHCRMSCMMHRGMCGVQPVSSHCRHAPSPPTLLLGCSQTSFCAALQAVAECLIFRQLHSLLW